MKLISCSLCTTLASITLAAADPAAVRVPLPLGYVTTDAGIRPVVGVPGAAYQGRLIDTNGLDIAAICSTLDYAIGFSDGNVHVFNLRTGESSAVHGVAARPVGVRLSPQGTSAALIFESRVDILSGLPGNARLAKTIQTTARAATVAVSDDGGATAIAIGNALTVVAGDDRKEIGLSRAVRDVRFNAATARYIYTDGVAVYTNADTMILGPADGLADVRVAAFSPDGRSVVVADGEAGQLLLASTTGEVRARLPLPCTASGLELMKDSTMRLRCENEMRIHVVDVSGTARVLFVPDAVE